MKVIISVCGTLTGPRIAKVLAGKGYLKKIYFTKMQPYRIEIDPDLVHSMPYFHYLAYALKWTILPSSAWYWTSKLFDLTVSKKDLSCDVFHGFSGHSLISMQKAKNSGAKVVIDMGAPHPLVDDQIFIEEYKRFGIDYKPDYQLTRRQLEEYEKADYILVPGCFVYRSFLNSGVSEEKLIEIPYGVDLNKFRIKKIKKDDTFRIIYVAGLGVTRGVQYLLEAYHQLNLKNSELILIGRAEKCLEPTLKKYEKEVKHLGFIEHHKLVDYYTNSSIFVCPSLSEGGPLTIYEAMACGLPVISTENTGSVARDGKEGFTVPIRDVEALKEKIRCFYENPSEMKRMSRNARKRIENYSWEKYAERIIEAYKKILN